MRALILAIVALGLLAASSAAADSSHAAAEICGGKKVKAQGGAIFNPDKRKSRTVTCLFHKTKISSTLGANGSLRALLGNKNKPLVCTFASYDSHHNLLGSSTSTPITSPGSVFLVLAVRAGGFASNSGYYSLSCTLPPKSRLLTVFLTEV